MKKLFASVFLLLFLSSCATPINSYQKSEFRSWESKGFAVRTKSSGAAAALGLLPGGGSFYTRNYGLGVTNLLFWPLSILWDPISGLNGAETINYYDTKAYVERMKRQEIELLEDDLVIKAISQEEYVLKSRAVRDKYAA